MPGALLALVLGSGGEAAAQATGPYRSSPVDTAHGDREQVLLWPEGAPGEPSGPGRRTGPGSPCTARPPRLPGTQPPWSARAAATGRWRAATRGGRWPSG